MSANDLATRQQLRRAIIASTIGTSIEWYDFFLYGSAAALVLNSQFFPNVDPTSGVLIAFGTNFVGFAARPVGAAIFGHYGDRIGRKATLVMTLALMGIGTFLVGLVPPYASIGILGGILLTFLRALQGIGVGGEWGGSVLLSMEWGGQTSTPGAGAFRSCSASCWWQSGCTSAWASSKHQSLRACSGSVAPPRRPS